MGHAIDLLKAIKTQRELVAELHGATPEGVAEHMRFYCNVNWHDRANCKYISNEAAALIADAFNAHSNIALFTARHDATARLRALEKEWRELTGHKGKIIT